MDNREFDALVRAAARGSSRRAVAKALGAGALGSAFALLARRAGAEEVVVEAETCRSTDSNCDGDSNCCSERCTAGTCVCRGSRERCRFNGRNRDKACCSGRCRKNGRCA
jgi:hypothetical protein